MNQISEERREELAACAAALARHNIVAAQLNCAESTLWGVLEALDLPMDETLLRMATPFGGGMGDSAAVCGALVAAIMALGVVLGRAQLDTPRKLVAYERTRRLYDRFVVTAGSDTCRLLNPLGFERPDLRPFCARFVELAARLAVEVLLTGDPEAERMAYAQAQEQR
jgi:C_GCAxxG_C_C family probable redox protein